MPPEALFPGISYSFNLESFFFLLQANEAIIVRSHRWGGIWETGFLWEARIGDESHPWVALFKCTPAPTRLQASALQPSTWESTLWATEVRQMTVLPPFLFCQFHRAVPPASVTLSDPRYESQHPPNVFHLSLPLPDTYITSPLLWGMDSVNFTTLHLNLISER